MEQKLSPAPPPVTASDAGNRVPSRFRALVRGNEIGLALVAILIGSIAGLLVIGISSAAQALHVFLFKLSPGERLSGAAGFELPALVFVPAGGGLLLGLVLFLLARRRRKRALVDPIEANALHGGRMSLTDSLIVVLQNLISNGFGASVGLEAAYTQIGSGIASRIGIAFEMRRGDMRTLVGCGAAGAIAAAFNAPLTGAFYAFELIIGTYSIATLTPVVAAALAGTLVARLFVGNAYLIDIGHPGPVGATDYPSAIALAILAAGLGILVMQTVTRTEILFRKSRVPLPLRPALGGLVLAGLAMLTPQVLSSGHGAMHMTFDLDLSVHTLVLLLGAKALASAISIGSGFRGGLFFASLFLGSILGKLFAVLALHLFGADALTPATYALVGMSAMAVSIIGGPLTMTFLALEMTGDLPITALVLAAVVAASLTVRKTFGYSFATWRFHLRGESIRSAHDVGWIRNLSVGRMMRRDLRTAPIDTALKVFRREFPLGSTQRVVITDRADAYVGIVLVPDAYSEDIDDLDATVENLVRFKDFMLLPQMNAREASRLFDAAESEALAVVDDPKTRKVLGLLTESHLLRRYSEELEARRREAAGETA
ncbi:chloride channel protein [Aureimonas endophytica]|uniref:Chloride channel protein n=1 Tax=Aureimonas endophytica TaxID=2027858 RepID=A0A916ZTN5_9HYPH|nr:chloride channel protein [Aureimonas endophytica]GGE13688.1 chloride channel protein [Aureimonas endophytica]